MTDKTPEPAEGAEPITDGTQPPELSEDPASTYGATEEYKAAWFEKYGTKDDDGNVVTEGTASDKTPGPDEGAPAPGGGADTDASATSGTTAARTSRTR